MMRRAFWILFLGAIAWWWLSGPSLVVDDLASALPEDYRPATFDSSLSITRAPLQRELAADVERLKAGDFTLTRRATFELEARVLGRRDYRSGTESRLSPLDLALGWGPMSDPEVLEQISFSQRRRFYFWRVQEFPIPRQQIERNSANMHMIPATGDIARQLDRIRTDQIVRLGGFLVDVDRDDGWQWRTSVTRDDTGDGACEIVLVTHIQSH